MIGIRCPVHNVDGLDTTDLSAQDVLKLSVERSAYGFRNNASLLLNHRAIFSELSR